MADQSESVLSKALAEAREDPLGALLALADELASSGAPKSARIVREAVRALESQLPTADEAAAERELGAWLVDHTGQQSPDIFQTNVSPDRWACSNGTGRLRGVGATPAATIRDALAKARAK